MALKFPAPRRGASRLAVVQSATLLRCEGPIDGKDPDRITLEFIMTNKGHDDLFNLQQESNSWIYPIRLEVSFSAPVVHPLNSGSTHWTGTIATPAVNLEKKEVAETVPRKESFIFARSSPGEGSPEVSIGTIVAKPDGHLVMRFVDRHGNPWEIGVEYRSFQKRDGAHAKAIDCRMEKKDGNGGSGTFSMRLVGQVMADGSMDGSFIRTTSPGYGSSDTGLVSVQKFTMRPFKHEEVEGDDGAGSSD